MLSGGKGEFELSFIWCYYYLLHFLAIQANKKQQVRQTHLFRKENKINLITSDSDNTSSQSQNILGEKSSYLRARYPLPYLCSRMADRRIFRYRTLCNHPRTIFWILMQAERNLSALSFSRYATCPALKKIFVFPNWNMSASLKRRCKELVTTHLCLTTHLEHKTIYKNVLS